MTFNELPIGAMFRFYVGGALLRKAGPQTYDAPMLDQKAIPVLNPSTEVQRLPGPLPSGVTTYREGE